ncbi:hypothetical protein ACWDA9_28115 [Streptomyces sp. NPDC001193]
MEFGAAHQDPFTSSTECAVQNKLTSIFSRRTFWRGIIDMDRLDRMNILIKSTSAASIISIAALAATPASANASESAENSNSTIAEVVVNQDIPAFHTINFSPKPCPASHPWLAKTGHLTPGRVGPYEGWSVEEPGWVGVSAGSSGTHQTSDPDKVFYTGITPQATNYTPSPP